MYNFVRYPQLKEVNKMNPQPDGGCTKTNPPPFRMPKMISTGINPGKKPTGFHVVGKNHSDSNCPGHGDCDCKSDCDCKEDCACQPSG